MKTRFSEINLIKELSSPRYQNLYRHFVPKTFANKALMFGPRHDDNLALQRHMIKITIGHFFLPV